MCNLRKGNLVNAVEKRFLPGCVREIVRRQRRIECEEDALANLREQAVLDLIEGHTSGDPLVDFMLLACNGVYDALMLARYKCLSDLGLRAPGTPLLIVQEATGRGGGGDVVTLRNLYRAIARPDMLDIFINDLTLGIPVMPRYLVAREFMTSESEHFTLCTVNADRLYVGPLYDSRLCPFTVWRKEAENVFGVPLDGVCAIYTPPWDRDRLYEEHGIDHHVLRLMQSVWLRCMNSSCTP